MATIKKYQAGGKSKKASRDSVSSEMFPGKMIPRSKSNYENGNFTKMLEGMRKQNMEAAAKKTVKKQKDGGKTPSSPAQKKFASLAAPKNKITFADKIAGAKGKKAPMAKKGAKVMSGMKKCKYGCK